jgi:hypothetical protein
MTHCQRQRVAFVLSVFTLTGCIVGSSQIDGPDPGVDAGTGTMNNVPDPTTTSPSPTNGSGSACALQPGNYHEVVTTSDSTCPAIAAQDVAIGATGTIVPGEGCTASSTADCKTTVACSGSSGQTTTSSTLVITTGGASATGTDTIVKTSTAPPNCSTSIFCPSGYCLSQGYCYQRLSTQTCKYDVTFTKT